MVAVFAFFLAVPVLRLLAESFASEAGAGIANYISVLTGKGFLTALGHSAAVSIASAVTATAIAFFLAYTIQYTNVPPVFKSLIRTLATLPMLLPTITYGFGGLLFGYVIYTLPVSFLLILNTMRYIDKKFSVVSRVMGDKPLKTFLQTVARPLLGTLAASMVQCFFLCFTDYGIPASVGGRYDVVATVLYNEMLGSVPDFNRGAVVAMMMLIPSAVSIALLRWLEKYNIRYSKISTVEIRKNRLRDGVFFARSSVFLLGLLSVFAVIFVVPLVSEWPYQTSFTLEHVISTLTDRSLTDVYQNSLLVAVCTAAGGLLVTCGSALATARSGLNSRLKAVIDGIALVTNTIPGMVVGIVFLFIFTGTPLQNTLILIIICNIVHFFSTPYLMMKNSLSKLNSSWEATASLMGDSWFQTIVRIITPNMASTLLEVFGYYFVNAMVTVSAVIFIAGARTMVITTKIKELQYYTKFNEVFVLSLLILFTNLAVKGLLAALKKRMK